MTPDEHDKIAASSQGITHFIGRSLKEIGGEDIMYFDPKNPESISENIEKLVFSESLLKENIKYGFERAKLFSWEKCAKETFEVYKRL